MLQRRREEEKKKKKKKRGKNPQQQQKLPNKSKEVEITACANVINKILS